MTVHSANLPHLEEPDFWKDILFRHLRDEFLDLLSGQGGLEGHSSPPPLADEVLDHPEDRVGASAKQEP